MEARHGPCLNLEAVADGGRRHLPQPGVCVVSGLVYWRAAHSSDMVQPEVGRGSGRRAGAGPRGVRAWDRARDCHVQGPARFGRLWSRCPQVSTS